MTIKFFVGRPVLAAGAVAAALVAGALLVACAESARQPLSAGIGKEPTLVAPRRTLLPTVNIAPAQGWADGAKPVAAAGMRVEAFARDLDHPRWLMALPNGDVLVAESNAPAKPDAGKGIKGWVMKTVMKRAGAGVPSANRITLLRDSDADGVADQRFVLLAGLNSPFGMALIGNDLFVANTDAVLRFAYRAGQTRIDAPGTLVTELPAGTINHHWTKNLIASADGKKLYVTVGSNSAVAHAGQVVGDEVAAEFIAFVDHGPQRRVCRTGCWHPGQPVRVAQPAGKYAVLAAGHVHFPDRSTFCFSRHAALSDVAVGAHGDIELLAVGAGDEVLGPVVVDGAGGQLGDQRARRVDAGLARAIRKAQHGVGVGDKQVIPNERHAKG